MPWATIEQITDQTGKTVSAEAVAVASAMIDTRAGTDSSMPDDSLTARDRGVLRKATAWQAVWVAPKLEQGLLDQREGSRQTTAAGVTDRRDTDASVLYAPLALLELRNLSWFGTRSVSRLPVLPPPVSFLNERSDAYGEWRPL